MSAGWTVEPLDETVEKELSELPANLRARLTKMSEMIEKHGTAYMKPPHSEHLGDGLYELRAKGAEGIARALYVTAAVRRVVIVRAFVKKTQKTPPREIRLARKRAKEVCDE